MEWCLVKHTDNFTFILPLLPCLSLVSGYFEKFIKARIDEVDPPENYKVRLTFGMKSYAVVE
jgi:hypothetical protein